MPIDKVRHGAHNHYMNRTELVARIFTAYAARGWAVPTSIEYAPIALLVATLEIATK